METILEELRRKNKERAETTKKRVEGRSIFDNLKASLVASSKEGQQLIPTPFDLLGKFVENDEAPKDKGILDAPNTQIVDGIELAFANAIPNGNSLGQAKIELMDTIQKNRTSDENGENIYVVEIDHLGETYTKIGRSKNEVIDRYKDHPYMLENMKVLFEGKVNNVGTIEKRWHGAKGVRELRLAQFGEGSTRGYAGETEISKKKVFKDGEFDFLNGVKNLSKKEIKDIQSVRFRKRSKNETTIDYRKKKNEFKQEKESIVKEKIGEALSKKDFQDLTTEELGILSEYKDEKNGGTLSPKGAGSLEDLLKNKNFRKDTIAVMSQIQNENIAPKKGEKITKDRFLRFFSFEKNNVGNMAETMYQLSVNEPEIAKKYANIIKIYESTNLSGAQLVEGIGNTITDVTSGIIGGLVLKTANKLGLGKKTTGFIVGSITGAADGASQGAVLDVADEVQGIDSGGKRTIVGAIIGFGLGGTVGGTMGAIAEKVSKYRGKKKEALKIQEEIDNLDAKQKAELDLEFETYQKNVSKIEKRAKKEEKAAEKELKQNLKKAEEDVIGLSKKEKKERLQEIVQEFNDKKKEIVDRKEKLIESGQLQKPKSRHAGLSKPEIDAVIALENSLNVLKKPGAEKASDNAVPFFDKTTFKGDARRVYAEENIISDKEGDIVIAQVTKAKNNRQVTEEIRDKLEAFKNNEKLTKQFGSTKSGDSKQDLRTPAEKLYQQLEFIIDATRISRKKESDPKKKAEYKKIERTAIEQIKNIKTIRLNREKVIERLDNRDIEYISEPKATKKYQKERAERLKAISKWGKKGREGKYFLVHRTDPTNAQKVIKESIETNRKDVNRAIDTIEAKNGSFNQEDIGNIERERGLFNEFRTVERHFNREQDLIDFGRRTKREITVAENRRLIEELRTPTGKKGELEEKVIKKEDILRRLEEIGDKSDPITEVEKKEKKKTENKKQYTDEEKEQFRQNDLKKNGDANHNERIGLKKKMKAGSLSDLKRKVQDRGAVTTIGDDISDDRIQEIRDISGLTDSEIVRRWYPAIENKKDKELINAKSREKLMKEVNDKKYKDTLGVERTTEKKEILNFTEQVVDFSNSMGQIIGMLLKSDNAIKWVGLDPESPGLDFRVEIASRIALKSEFKDVTKKEVKEVFVPWGYGQGEEGSVDVIMKNLGYNRKKAERFRDEVYKELTDIVPEFANFRKFFREFASRKGVKKEIVIKTLNGDRIKIEIGLEGKKTFKIKGASEEILYETDDVNKMSRAIMPAIVQSIDASIIKGIIKDTGENTIHDAIKASSPEKLIGIKESAYRQMKLLFESDLLNNITKDLTGKEGKKRVSNYNIEDYKKTKALEVEVEIGPKTESIRIDRDNTSILDEESMIEEYIMSKEISKDNFRTHLRKVIRERTLLGDIEEKDRTMMDDMFDIAIKNEKWDDKLAIKMPEELHKRNKKAWNEVQKRTYERLRSMIEFHPLLHETGKKTRYNPRRKIMAEQIIKEEIELAKKGDPLIAVEINKLEEQLGINYEQLVSSIRKEGHVKLTKEQVRILVEKRNKELNDMLQGIDRTYTKKWRKQKGISAKAFNKRKKEIKKFYKEERIRLEKKKLDIKSTHIELWNKVSERSYGEGKITHRIAMDLQNPKVREDQTVKDLIAKTRDIDTTVNESAKTQHDELKRIYKSELIDSKEITENIINSGYAIHGMERKEAQAFQETNKEIYRKAEKWIKKAATALGDRSQEYGHYVENSRDIMELAGIKGNKDKIPYIIDSLISLEKMSKKNWDFIESIKGTESLNVTLGMMKEIRKRQRRFTIDRKMRLKRNYIEETYNGIIGQDGKILANAKFKKGFIPTSRSLYKKQRETEIELPKDMSKSELLDWAEENKVRLGKSTGYKVQTKEERKTQGISESAEEILAKTMLSVAEREAEETRTAEVVAVMTNQVNIFSNIEKEGFIKVPEERLKFFKKDLQANMKFINEKYFAYALGEKENRIVSDRASQIAKVTDRLFKDITLRFKKNVVLKSPSSIKNALLVNLVTAAIYGVNPIKMYKAHKEVFKLSKEMSITMQEIARFRMTGKNTAKLEERLKKNKIYKLRNKGLAIGLADGALEDASVLDTIVGKAIPKGSKKILKTVFLEQGTFLGDKMLSLFNDLDTAGRVIMYDKFKKTMSEDKAVNRANGLFGDMRAFNPRSIEILDGYPLAPFISWFYNVAPSMLRMHAERPLQTLTAAVVIYAIAEGIDVNLSGISPTETLIDMPEGFVTGFPDLVERYEKEETMEFIASTGLKYISPSIMNKYIMREIRGIKTSQSIPRLLFPRFSNQKYYYDGRMATNPAGLSQQIVEGFNGEETRIKTKAKKTIKNRKQKEKRKKRKEEKKRKEDK